MLNKWFLKKNVHIIRIDCFKIFNKTTLKKKIKNRFGGEISYN